MSAYNERVISGDFSVGVQYRKKKCRGGFRITGSYTHRDIGGVALGRLISGLT